MKSSTSKYMDLPCCWLVYFHRELYSVHLTEPSEKWLDKQRTGYDKEDHDKFTVERERIHP